MPHPRIAAVHANPLTHVPIHHCPSTPARRHAGHAAATPHYDYPDPMPAPPLAILWLLAAALICVVAGAGALVAMWLVNL